MLEADAFDHKVGVLGDVLGTAANAIQSTGDQHDVHGVPRFKRAVADGLHELLENVHHHLRGFVVVAADGKGAGGVSVLEGEQGIAEHGARAGTQRPEILFDDGGNRLVRERDLLGDDDGFISDAFQIQHHAHDAHEKAEIAGNGLRAGEDVERGFVDLVFEVVDIRIPVEHGGGAGKIVIQYGDGGIVEGLLRLAPHDEEFGAQVVQKLLRVVFLIGHKASPWRNALRICIIEKWAAYPKRPVM